MHHHGPASPASPHLRRLLLLVITPLIVLTIVGLVAIWPSPSARSGRVLAGPGTAPPLVNGQVVDVDSTVCRGQAAEAGAPDCMLVSVRITSGDDRGDVVTYERSLLGGEPVPEIGAACGWS